VGLPRESAERCLEVIDGAIMDNVSTKEDLSALRNETKEGFKAVRQEVKQEFVLVRKEIGEVATEFKNEFVLMRQEMGSLENRLFLRLGGLMIVLFGLLATKDQWTSLIL